MMECKLPAFVTGLTYSDWDRKMINFLSTKRILKSWDEDNIPGNAPKRLPVATSAEAFISKVKPDADFRLIAGVARGVTAGDIDEDVLGCRKS